MYDRSKDECSRVLMDFALRKEKGEHRFALGCQGFSINSCSKGKNCPHPICLGASRSAPSWYPVYSLRKDGIASFERQLSSERAYPVSFQTHPSLEQAI